MALLFLVDDLRLRIHVGNDWELAVYWNAAKYEAQMPEDDWSYKVVLMKW